MKSRLLAILLTLGLLGSMTLPVQAISVQGAVGPQSAADGTNPTLRMGRDGAAVVQDAHSKYQEMAVRGNLWYCANAAGTSVTTQAGLSVTTPMLTLYNPINSGKNLVLIEVNVTPTAAPAAAAGFMIAVSSAIAAVGQGTAGAIVSATAGTIQNAQTGSLASSAAQCFRISTLPFVPVAVRYFGGTTGAAAISGAMFTDAVDGKIIVSPGSAISIQTTSAVAGIAHFLWEEVPL